MADRSNQNTSISTHSASSRSCSATSQHSNSYSKRYAKFFIIANLFLATGLLLNYALPPLIDSIIDQRIALTQNSQSYPMWKDPPVPIYQKFYFFNVTNAQDVELYGAKPQVDEIGPFTYRSVWSKRDIEHDDSKSTINFKHFKTWHFEPELSIADHRLQLVTLNAPLAITLTLIQSSSSAVRLLVTFSLDGLSEGFFTKRTVKQLLFDGYPDFLTTFGPLLNAEMLSQGGHFGYMNARNNTLDGTYEVNTGYDDVSKLNTINRHNGRSHLSYWYPHSSQCNSLIGASTGEIFPPITNDHQSISLFQPDFCRAWRLDQTEQSVQGPDGLRLKRFHATRDVFRNSTDLPENVCFFASKSRTLQRVTNQQVGSDNKANSTSQPHEQDLSTARQAANPNSHRRQPARQSRQSTAGHINRLHRQQQQQQPASATNHHQGGRQKARQEWPSGVFSLAPCKFNAPIYMSMPHFLDADPFFGNSVDGLKPDPQKHEFFVDLEPRTGSPVQVAARVQVNVAISKPPGLVRFRNVPEIMFPVFWQELTVNLTGPVIDQLVLAARGAQETNVKISYCFSLVGIAILITTCLFYLNSRFRGDSKE